MRAFISFCLFALAVFAVTTQAHAKETDIVITVKAKDAKFIGTAIGGAEVQVIDKRTGDIIAFGKVIGDSGDTETIMSGSRERDAVLRTDGTAKYEFSLDLFEPTAVTIKATGPMAQPQSLVSATYDTILIPGKDYTSGDGILVELPGFAVDILYPRVGQEFPHNSNMPVTIETNIVKLCGCEISEDSPWPPSRYQVDAHVFKDNRYITSVAMAYGNEASQFIANIRVPLPGVYQVVVTAFDPVTKEAGMDSTSIELLAASEE